MRGRVIGLVLLSVLLALLILGLSTIPKQDLSEPEETPKPVNLSGFIVLSAGQNSELYLSILSRLEERGAQIKSFEIPEIPEVPVDRNETIVEEELELEEGNLLLFDSLWLSERIEDVKLHRVFIEALKKEIPLAAIGPDTSKFFDVLNKAGIHEFPEEANPGSSDFPLVGLKTTERTYDAYLYPYKSFLYSNTEDVDTLFKALIDWARS